VRKSYYSQDHNSKSPVIATQCLKMSGLWKNSKGPAFYPSRRTVKSSEDTFLRHCSCSFSFNKSTVITVLRQALFLFLTVRWISTSL